MKAINKNTNNTKRYRLWYSSPAPDDDRRSTTYTNAQNTGWEVLALPIANGYMGAKIFGITEHERVQINENTLSTSGTTTNSGTTNMTELYLHFGHEYESVKNYHRELDIENAISTVGYTYGGVDYLREYFASYPDGVTVISLKASGNGNLSFTLEPKIPYFEYEKKTGDVIAKGNTVTMFGHLPGSNLGYNEKMTVGYEMDFEASFRVFTSGGTVSAENPGGSIDSVDEYSNGRITVTNADSAYVIVSVGTNYELCPDVFKEPNNKKLDGLPHPHEKIARILEAASKKSLDELRNRHVSDYSELFSRASISLTEETPQIPTDALFSEYKEGRHSHYLEELIFSYGRYLHIASSRPGCMPSNLNGIWNRYHAAICKNGYWSNINTQMNYWSSFNTNIAECFEAYLGYYEAYAEPNHGYCVEELLRKGFIKSEDEVTGRLWSISTGCSPFDAYPSVGGRDGWGNTPFMAELFYDYYDYTKDKELLKKRILPALIASANFLSYVMKPQRDGLYLASPSGSPEQSTTKPYLEYVEAHPGYVPVGSAYDQSMTYSNYLNVFKAIRELGLTDPELEEMGMLDTVCRLREQIDLLSPIVIGASGQVKEFREENYYGEIGEPEHRHISQLCALVQGASMGDSRTPAWIDASEVTMNNRGMTPHAWAYVMRICSWARIGDGEAGYKVLNYMLCNQFGENLLSLLGGKKLFQVEGVLGTPCAITEFLLQSHDDCIAPLPALPSVWRDGSYSGLVARGAFEVSATWHNGYANTLTVLSKAGGECRIKYYNLASAKVTDSKGRKVKFANHGTDLISFDTVKGELYTITDIKTGEKLERPSDLTAQKAENGIRISWNASADAVAYRIYRAEKSEPRYALIGDGITATEYTAREFSNCQATYAVTAISKSGRESRRAHAIYIP